MVNMWGSLLVTACCGKQRPKGQRLINSILHLAVLSLRAAPPHCHFEPQREISCSLEPTSIPKKIVILTNEESPRELSVTALRVSALVLDIIGSNEREISHCGSK